MFEKHPLDVVKAGGFVTRELAKGFIEHGGGEFAYDHVLGGERLAGVASSQENAPLGSILESGKRDEVSICLLLLELILGYW